MARAKKTTATGIDYAHAGMSMSQIKRLIVDTYFGGIERQRSPKPIYCQGPPGVGKTSVMMAAAREIERRLKAPCLFIDVPTSTLEPCDVAGIPFPVRTQGGNGVEREMYSSYLAPSWAWLISKEYEQHERLVRKDPTWKAPAVLILFDDLVAAHFQTQAAFYKGVHEGKWGELHQRDNVMLVACGNRIEDNAAANDMPTPLANRFRHCYALPTAQDWLRWASEYREENEPGIKGQDRIHPLVQAYIRVFNDDLQEFDSEVANRADKAFSSARTVEDLSELLYEGQISFENDEDYFSKTVRGIVGQGVGTKFMAFMRNTGKAVPPDVIVKNPKKAPVPGRTELDALHATIASLETFLKANPQYWKQVIEYSLRPEILPDVGICLAQTATTVIKGFQPKERDAACGDDIMGEMWERYEDLLDIIKR